MSTEPKCCKQKTCSMTKPFRCNTYKKPGGPFDSGFSDVQTLACLAPGDISGHNVTSHSATKDYKQCSMHGMTFLPATTSRATFKRGSRFPSAPTRHTSCTKLAG